METVEIISQHAELKMKNAQKHLRGKKTQYKTSEPRIKKSYESSKATKYKNRWTEEDFV